jgi:hypothetical protein
MEGILQNAYLYTKNNSMEIIFQTWSGTFLVLIGMIMLALTYGKSV